MSGTPSVDAVEYGRRIVGSLIEKYERFEREAKARGDDAAAARWRTVHVMLVRDLYGHEDGGCVITAFDKRWLDPHFRRVMGEAFAAADGGVSL